MRPRKGGTLFGHSSDCYNWDNRCHCGSDQPLVLPPEDTTQFYSENLQAASDYVPGLYPQSRQSVALAGREQYGLASRVPQGHGREAPLLGHAPQCYHLDNRCHCSSSMPYLLPPEGAPSSSRLAPQQHLYDAISPSGMAAANTNTNTSSLHNSSAAAAGLPYGQGRSSEVGATAGVHPHNQAWPHTHQLTDRTNSVQCLPQYNNSLRTQLHDHLDSSGHNSSDDLPPSYSELFPDK